MQFVAEMDVREITQQRCIIVVRLVKLPKGCLLLLIFKSFPGQTLSDKLQITKHRGHIKGS